MKKTLLAIGCAVAANSVALTVQPDPQNAGGYVVLRSEVQSVEAQKTSAPEYAIWSKALAVAPNTTVDAILPGRSANPDNVKRAERVFPEAQWQFLTGMAAPEYTYRKFLQAIGKFPAFCGDYTDGRDADAICKKSIITAFAHFAQETGGHIAKDNVWDNPNQLEEWQQALVHVREMGYSEGMQGYTTGCGSNDWQNRKWPCAPGVGYFGRGAKQLSYHYNYGAFSEVMFDGDATVLLDNPALVADTWLNLASAIWFFLTPQSPKPAMLHVIDRTWVPSQAELDAGIGYGFGTTINVINGGVECGEHNKTKGQPVNRISYWRGLRDHYQIPVEADEVDTCWQQTPYSGVQLQPGEALFTNWEAVWSSNPNHPGGHPMECQLVGYQTAYSALVPGDYEKCVTNFYQSHQSWPEVRVVDTLPNVTPTPSITSIITPVPTGSITMRPWVPGTVDPATGDTFSYQGACYEAQHNPGKWDTPPNAWFWKTIDCATAVITPTPVVTATPVVTTTPILTPTPVTQCAPTYVDNARYATGDTVSLNGDTYQCSVGGWCSIGGAYAPDGWAGNHAWQKTGTCQ